MLWKYIFVTCYLIVLKKVAFPVYRDVGHWMKWANVALSVKRGVGTYLFKEGYFRVRVKTAFFYKKDRSPPCVLLTTHMLGLREGYVNRGDENNNIILILQDVFTKQLILKVTKQTALLHYHSGHRNSVKNSTIKTFRENHFNTLDGQCKDNDYTYIS